MVSESAMRMMEAETVTGLEGEPTQESFLLSTGDTQPNWLERLSTSAPVWPLADHAVKGAALLAIYSDATVALFSHLGQATHS